MELPELKESQRKIRLELWKDALKAALFIKDIEEVETAFETADAETGRKLDTCFEG